MSRGHQPTISEARRSRTTHEALPPYRIDRPPKTAAEHDALRKHCRQVVATLQGRLLSRKEINIRAEAMANEAIAEASRLVREAVKGRATLVIAPGLDPNAPREPTAEEMAKMIEGLADDPRLRGEKRTPGGLIIP